MSESDIQNDDRLVDVLRQLDIEDMELKEALIRSLDALAREPELLMKLEKLSQENMRLKQEVVRMRDIIYSKDNGNMSSKLRDALRE